MSLRHSPGSPLMFIRTQRERLDFCPDSFPFPFPCFSHRLTTVT